MKFWEPIARRSSSVSCRSLTPAERSPELTGPVQSYSSSSPATAGQSYGRCQHPYFPKVSFYDGKDDFKSFLAVVEQMSIFYGWSDIQKLMFLTQNLTGVARDVYSQLKPMEKNDFSIVAARLLKIFGRRDTPSILQSELHALRQKEEEDLDDFGKRIMQKAYLAYPTANEDMLSTIIKQIFFKGCINKEAAETAINQSPVDLNDAVEKTRVAASNHAMLNPGKQKVRKVSFEDDPIVRRVQEDRSKPDVLTDIQATLSKLVSAFEKMVPLKKPSMSSPPPIRRSSSPISSPARTSPTPSPVRTSPSRIKCYNCQGYGHIAAKCPSPKSALVKSNSSEQLNK